MKISRLFICMGIAGCLFGINDSVFAGTGAFDMERWDSVISGIKIRATNEKISDKTIRDTTRSLVFIPSIVRHDTNQNEFKLTLDMYLNRTINAAKIARGREMQKKYPTLLSRVEKKYGIPKNVMLAFWGMESYYGDVKSKYKLTDAFITLIYDGRREKFFTNQLLALMKIADENGLNINDIYGSWAGAMGHFQFIPTTLQAYGVDGNNDNKIDIIGSVSDAMFSAGNYLNKLGWNKNQRIVRRVVLPGTFDTSLLDGKTKKTLSQWAQMGVVNIDGSDIPNGELMVGLVADYDMVNSEKNSPANIIANASDVIDTDIAPMPTINAYLTYPNFYRIKRWNNSNWYAIAIAELADKLK